MRRKAFNAKFSVNRVSDVAYTSVQPFNKADCFKTVITIISRPLTCLTFIRTRDVLFCHLWVGTKESGINSSERTGQSVELFLKVKMKTLLRKLVLMPFSKFLAWGYFLLSSENEDGICIFLVMRMIQLYQHWW